MGQEQQVNELLAEKERLAAERDAQVASHAQLSTHSDWAVPNWLSGPTCVARRAEC